MRIRTNGSAGKKELVISGVYFSLRNFGFSFRKEVMLPDLDNSASYNIRIGFLNIFVA